MTLHEVGCAGLILIRSHATSEPNYHFDLLLMVNGKGNFVLSKGRIELNETRFVAAQRSALESTGLTPDDYTVFQHFGFVVEDDGCPKTKFWVALVKNVDQPIKLSPEYLEFTWVKIGVPSATESLSVMGKVTTGMKELLSQLADNGMAIQDAVAEFKKS